MLDRSGTASPRTPEDFSELSGTEELTSRSGTPEAEFVSDEDDSPQFSDTELAELAERFIAKLEKLTRTTLETEQDTPAKEAQKKSQIRDACLANLAQCKQSNYFQSLARRLNNHEKLVPAEYMLYALITDNVNNLDLTLLQGISEHCNNAFSSHIHVLIAMREWQTAAGITEKKNACNKFISALNARNHDLFLNLRGANLSGANLTSADFNFTNLDNADLSHTEMDNTRIHFSSLNHANLSCINHPAKRGLTAAPTIFYTTAQNSCFDGVSFAAPRWEHADFTGASFKHVHLSDAHFQNTLFDKADFNGSAIKLAPLPPKAFCSFKEAHLAEAVLIAADFKNIDITEANLIGEDDLQCALDKIQEKTLKICALPDADECNLPEKIRHRQNIIAENLIHHLNQLNPGADEMIEYLEIALEHPLFQPQSLIEKMTNDADRVFHFVEASLFGKHRHHDIYQTKAMKMLETAMDRIIEQHQTRASAVNSR